MDKPARSALKMAILASVLVFNVLYYASRFPTMKNGIDFPEFYCAARMVLEGAGSHLYEIPAQQDFQGRYTGRIGVLFNHPPFETLFYLPIGWLNYRAAYVCWTMISTLLVAVSMLIINREARLFSDPGPLIMLSFIFAPLALNLLQGQDVAILLLCYAITYAKLRRNQAFTAGCVLALGLFKPHLVLPCFVVIFVVSKSWKFVGGFAAIAALLFVISVAISGWRALLAYPSFVVNLGHVQLAGYHPNAMANWRGLVSLLMRSSRLETAVLVVGSVLLLWLAIAAGRRLNSTAESTRAGDDATTVFNLAFANTTVATLLVSYHLSPHDLTILLLPMAVVLAELRRRGLRMKPLDIVLAIVLLFLFFPPLYVITLGLHTYALLSIPIIIFFGCLLMLLQRAAQTRGFEARA
jgi:glycosyl transferase family 87